MVHRRERRVPRLPADPVSPRTSSNEGASVKLAEFKAAASCRTPNRRTADLKNEVRATQFEETRRKDIRRAGQCV